MILRSEIKHQFQAEYIYSTFWQCRKNKIKKGHKKIVKYGKKFQSTLLMYSLSLFPNSQHIFS